MVGGRAACDRETFGFPYDIGGFWLCDDGDNPLMAAARDHGFDISNGLFPFPDMPMAFGDRWEEPPERTERLAYNEARFRGIATFDPMGPDCNVAALSPSDVRWEPVLDVWFSIVQNGYQADISTLDLARSRPGPYLQVKEGLGNLLTRWAGDNPVRLNAPVTKIETRTDCVILGGSGFELAARAAIVTTSVGVIRDGVIAFKPTLPNTVSTACEQLPMGNVNRIAVQFDRDIFGDDCPPAFGQFGAPDDYILLLTRLVGQNVALGYVGGTFADHMEQRPKADSVALLCKALELAVGFDPSAHICAVHCTRWRSDPWTRGGYTIAKPGGADARLELQKPLGGRLFFAGEATSPTQFAQVHGAVNEGVRAARAASQVT